MRKTLHRKESLCWKFYVTFEKGKKYAIIGKSGSGKSTLLKLTHGEQVIMADYSEVIITMMIKKYN